MIPLRVLVALLVAAPATADDAAVAEVADAGADGPLDAALDQAPPVQEQDAAKVWASCTEHVPEGAERPTMSQSFPARGLSGYSLPLVIKLEHGLGETVLPHGFRIQSDSDAARAIAGAGFSLPSAEGGAGPSREQRREAQRAITELTIPFVALPPEPGRHELVLPPIPIAIARANGELVTLCTSAHAVVLDDPIANETEPAPKENPEPRVQRELWTLARDLTYGALAGAAAAALLAWLVVRWMRRPKPLPPPPPPRPPWEVALEQLETIRRQGLVQAGLLGEHVDRVSDAVRLYLGARYGFDGIESTTDEVLQAMARRPEAAAASGEIQYLLQECDLVKFARLTPSEEECSSVLDKAEQIVRMTMPAVLAPQKSSTQPEEVAS